MQSLGQIGQVSLILFTAIFLSGCDANASEVADRVLINGVIETMNPEAPDAENADTEPPPESDQSRE